MRYSVQTNQLTDTLIDRVTKYAPDWDKIVSRAMQQRPLKAKEKSIVVEAIRESFLQLALEDSVKYCKAEKRVNLRALPRCTETQHYRVTDDYDGKHTIWSKQFKRIPYDAIILADNLPVVIDLGIEGPRYNNEQRCWKLSPEVKDKALNGISKFGQPIEELCSTTTFGYVLLLSQENDRPHSHSLLTFLQNGGSLGIFPFHASDFYTAVIKAARAHGLVAPKESNTPKTADTV